jgi:hypothetical protein
MLLLHSHVVARGRASGLLRPVLTSQAHAAFIDIEMSSSFSACEPDPSDGHSGSPGEALGVPSETPRSDMSSALSACDPDPSDGHSGSPGEALGVPSENPTLKCRLHFLLTTLTHRLAIQALRARRYVSCGTASGLLLVCFRSRPRASCYSLVLGGDFCEPCLSSLP